MTLRDSRPILAIDPTKRGLAFVFFEDGELIDWGTRECPRRIDAMLRLLDVLIDHCGPDVLVLEDGLADGCVRRARVREFLRWAARHAGRRDLVIAAVARREVREVWRKRGCTTKQAIAASVITHFPELAHLLPPPRKLFADEPERIRLFDALSLLLAVTDFASSVTH
jgi:hypothetical protein